MEKRSGKPAVEVAGDEGVVAQPRIRLTDPVDFARLAGRQVRIEDHALGAELHRAEQDLVELAAADERARIDLGAALHQHVEHLDAGRAAQLAELAVRE